MGKRKARKTKKDKDKGIQSDQETGDGENLDDRLKPGTDALDDDYGTGSILILF